MRNRPSNGWHQRLRRADLRRGLPLQLRWLCRWRRERISGGLSGERLHLHSPQTLFSEPVMAPLQPALQEAAEAAQHDDEGPDQPEAGETGQEGRKKQTASLQVVIFGWLNGGDIQSEAPKSTVMSSSANSPTADAFGGSLRAAGRLKSSH
ncbi:hypothetical protein CHARACLAT_019207 [Characodon lateralis]|uniref:Uncharacterized protein n=1 Tax=Characodon lateralis TaxID=208331 RepID=A0ABU7CPW9_9TELE|nr:hypothetical protein [Characodon lateralis]